jgi:hypothetical protein
MEDPKPATTDETRCPEEAVETGPSSWGSAFTPWGPELSLVEAAARSLLAAIGERWAAAEATR